MMLSPTGDELCFGNAASLRESSADITRGCAEFGNCGDTYY